MTDETDPCDCGLGPDRRMDVHLAFMDGTYTGLCLAVPGKKLDSQSGVKRKIMNHDCGAVASRLTGCLQQLRLLADDAC